MAASKSSRLSVIAKTLLLLAIVLPCIVCALGYGYFTKAPEFMARWTLAAIIRGDREAVTAMGNTGDEWCRDEMQSLYDRYHLLIGNAVVRNVSIESQAGTGSADAVFVDISFDYQKPNENEWRQGHIRFFTYIPNWGWLYAGCGDRP